ncbi:hypothetical protein HDU87_006907 [Geranomyces variabilis]|uniref:Indoleamine 2,3-dioxygenase n=1 Tax=Geranomyces variabilis TaxID=109894 RepID=A0AAD5TKB5_9FUNG|nr:hypothetical protein HDU87_006907 [Geranomyces variabilis]
MNCPFASSRTTPPATPPPSHFRNNATIPTLKDYDVDPIYGFLPANPMPIRRLPAAYEPWENILDNLNALLLAGSLRKTVENLPLLSTDLLANDREWQRAYLVLSFIGQAYVWGHSQQASEVLPVTIARPWNSCSERLGLLPVITYASVTLYNYRLIDPSGPLKLDNMAVMHTFTGSDEAWFYLVSIASEAEGAPALSAILSAMHAVKAQDLEALNASLTTIGNSIEAITKVMLRMYERNDPYVFYNRVRHFLTGWEDSNDLPNGVYYEGVDSVPGAPAKCPISGFSAAKPSTESLSQYGSKPLQSGAFGKYAGASTGQSSMMHCLDVALGIEHRPTRTGRCTAANFNLEEAKAHLAAASSSSATSTKSPTGCPVSSSGSTGASAVNHILEMRKYMPGPHRAFIEALERGPSIRAFVENLTNNPALDANGNSVHDPALAAETTRLYNRCVSEMRGFRDRHLQIVAAYIVTQARKKRDAEAEAPQEDPATISIPSPVTEKPKMREVLQARGTGGTDLIPFLKQSRQETIEALVTPQV